MNNDLNRRDALAAISLAAAIPSGSKLSKAEWYRLRDRYNEAVAAYEAWDEAGQADYDAFHAAAEAIKPNLSYTVPGTSLKFDYWRDVSQLDRQQPLLPEEVRQELNARYAEYQAEYARLSARYGMSEMIRQDREHSDNISRLADQLLGTPAPDQEALLWKMEHLWLGDEEASWSKEAVSAVLSDARRLLSTGRA